MAILAPTLFAAPKTHFVPPPAKRIVGYYTNWALYSGFNVKNFEDNGSAARMTHLLYAFANVNTSGLCQSFDPWADEEVPISAANNLSGQDDPGYWAGVPTINGNFGQLIRLKALHPKLKMLVSIGGWTGSANFSAAAATDASRKAFVASCLDIYIRGNLNDPPGPSIKGLFDGIDIDWEYPASCGLTCSDSPADTQNFTLLLAEFRRQLDAQGKLDHENYLLAAAIPAGPSNYSLIELNKIWQYLDFVNMMTYDYHGTWETTTNNLAPLFADPADPSAAGKFYIDHTVSDFLKAGIPARKLNLGLPFYGYGWQGVPNVHHGLYQPSTGAAAAGGGTLNYSDLKTLTGFTPYRDPHSLAFSIYNPTTGVFWSYDDPATIWIKLLYAKFKAPGGLGGSMFWELSGDDANGTLVRTIYDASW